MANNEILQILVFAMVFGLALATLWLVLITAGYFVLGKDVFRLLPAGSKAMKPIILKNYAIPA